MVTKNEITGDKIQTKPTTKEYADGWDAIFGNKEEVPFDFEEEVCSGRMKLIRITDGKALEECNKQKEKEND